MQTHITGRGPRRIAVAAAATALAAGLVACSEGSGGDGGDRALTFVPGVAGDSFYISMQCGIQAEAKKHDMTVDVQAPEQFDPSLQTPIVNGVVAKKPDGLLIAPTDAKAMVSPLLQAQQAGIKIGLVDTTLEEPSVAETSAHTDNLKGGAAAADALAEMIGEEGKVLVIAFQAGASTSDDRQQGFEEQIKKYDNVEYLGAEINDNSPAKAASIISATLSAHPDLKGVFATNQFAAEGVATGLRNADDQSGVKVVGFDAGPVQTKQLERGDVQALIAQKPYEIGTQAVTQLAAALDGKEPKKQLSTGTVTVTQENLARQKDALYKTSC